MAQKILLIEDEPQIVAVVRGYLVKAGSLGAEYAGWSHGVVDGAPGEARFGDFGLDVAFDGWVGCGAGDSAR
ncbi:MAG: hypothetical protein ACPGWR_12945 [Ardenticatenaceae bacterium]